MLLQPVFQRLVLHRFCSRSQNLQRSPGNDTLTMGTIPPRMESLNSAKSMVAKGDSEVSIGDSACKLSPQPPCLKHHGLSQMPPCARCHDHSSSP